MEYLFYLKVRLEKFLERSKMNFNVVIPARYNSSRIPGKPLAMINGKPMMWHVYQRALESCVLDEVYIATDDERISNVADEYELNTIMTSTKHKTGTDRVAEAANQILADYYVNIQVTSIQMI